MPSLGEILRAAREARAVTLDAAARDTRIQPRFLEALESETLGDLPDSVFAKGYVRCYAEYLGLDPVPLVDAYVRLEEAQVREGRRMQEPDTLAAMHDIVVGGKSPGVRRPSVLAFAGGAVTILLVIGAWIVLGWLRGKDAEAPARAYAGGTETAAPSKRTVVIAEPGAAPPARTVMTAAPGAAMATPRPHLTKTVVAPPPAVAARPPTLSIEAAGVGTGVVNRELVGQGDRFEPGIAVSYWTRVAGGTDRAAIAHVWMHEGRVVQTVTLSIGGSPWRTHSRKTLNAPGAWAVEARDPEGRVLDRREFACTTAR